jgi:hypothetical protein
MHQKYLRRRRGDEAAVLEMYRRLDAEIAAGFEPPGNDWQMLDEAYDRTFPPSASAPKRSSSSFLDDVNAQLKAASGGQP